MIKPPVISIIIPSYNRVHTLPETIDSVLNQSYPDWELIIVDDRSTDNTAHIIHQYIEKDPRIRYILNDRTQGPAGARNSGICNSRGKYLAFLDSDDQWYPNHLEDSLKAIKEEGVKVCFALWQEKDHEGKLIGALDSYAGQKRFNEALQKLKIKQNSHRSVFPAPGFAEFTSLKTLHCCHINTMLIEKDVIDRIGLLNEKLLIAEDTDFIFRIHISYDFCLISNFHFIYNQNPDSLYNFINRQILDKEKILYDTELINRLTSCGLSACKMWQLKKKFIHKAQKFNNRKLCMKKCDKKMAAKYCNLGYINKKHNKILSIRLLIKSLYYAFSIEKIKLLINIVFPFAFRHMDLKFSEYWLS